MINTLREKFLNYHRDRGFGIYESFPLVINDPTILFTNATVTPFKSRFTGDEKRENFALVQKCLRLGGTGGDLETPRLNANYTSIFDMLGSGLFDVSQDTAVAYFVEVLLELGLKKERLAFTALSDFGYEMALERAGIEPQQVRLFTDARDIQHEWSFGEGDLHGCGIIVRYVPNGFTGSVSDCSLFELASYVQIGRIVHIDGIARGSTVESFSYSAYDIGIGLNRVETALMGNCEQSLHPWRVLSDQLQTAITKLSRLDAHYTANLFRIAEDLVGEGLLPGKKKHAYALRKVMRLLIEEVWLKSEALVDISTVLVRPFGVSPCQDLLRQVIYQEEVALRGVLSAAVQKQKKHPDMTPEELRATFGIRPSLLGL